MNIYNETKTEIITNPDFTLGYLKEDTLTIHHEAVEAVEEVSHYETLREYPNGGKDVKLVIDVPGVKASDAYDEVQRIQVYVPYTEAEIAKMKAEEEIAELKNYLSETDYCVIKCMELGLSISTAYPEVHQKRTEARSRINELETAYSEL